MCENEKNAGRVILCVPKGVDTLDVIIMRHIASEVGKLVGDGICDLEEYGGCDKWDVTVVIQFERKEVSENGR